MRRLIFPLALLVSPQFASCDAPEAPQPQEKPEVELTQRASEKPELELTQRASAPSPHDPSTSASSRPKRVDADQFEPCEQICKVGVELACGKSVEECVPHCHEMLSIPACQAEMRNALECFSKQSAGSWMCDADEKMPVLREGSCNKEQAAMARCMAG